MLRCLADLWSVDEHSRSCRSGSSKTFGPRGSSSVTKLCNFVTDEDPRGPNVLLEPDLQLRECSSTLHKSNVQQPLLTAVTVLRIRIKPALIENTAE